MKRHYLGTVLVALCVACGLLFFDELDVGLGVINLLVWSLVLFASVAIVMLQRKRGERRSSRRRHHRPRTALQPAPAYQVRQLTSH